MKHADLFKAYQETLEWINRRKEPQICKFFKEEPAEWNNAKLVAFSMYQKLRYFCEDDIFSGLGKSIEYFKSGDPNIPPPFDGCEACGVLYYRDNKYIIYNDEAGAEEFIVLNGEPIEIRSMFRNETDWYYMVDRVIDKI